MDILFVYENICIACTLFILMLIILNMFRMNYMKPSNKFKL